MMDRPTLKHCSCPLAGSDLLTTLWSTLRTAITRLGKYLNIGCYSDIVAAQILIISILEAKDTATKAAWDKVTSGADCSAALNAIYRVCIPLVTHHDTQAAVRLLDRLVAKEDYANSRHRAEAWRTWITEALKKGAGKACQRT